MSASAAIRVSILAGSRWAAAGTPLTIHLRSSFSAEAGTWIGRGGGAFEGDDVAGIAHRPHESFYFVRGVSAATASSALEQRGAAVGAIVRDGDKVGFTAPGISDAEVTAALSAVGADVEVLDDLGTVSVVSVGIARKPAITARALTDLVSACEGALSEGIGASVQERADAVGPAGAL